MTGANGLFETGGFLLPSSSSSRHESGEMLLLEKQGLASQQQRMPEAAVNAHAQSVADASAESADGASSRHRSGSLPPSSLPRPPRSHRSGLPKRLGEYNRLENSERKKSDGGDSLSSAGSGTKRQSPARSLIPPPRKLGEYGRLSESDSRSSLRKTSTRSTATPVSSERNSASTLSDNSASSLPPPSKLRLFSTSQPTRRGSSLGREGKSTNDGSSKYRIQF